MRSLAITCTAFLVFACGSAAPPEETARPNTPTETIPSALLGTGLEQFVALSEGDELLVEQGYQGGFHLTVNARAEGFSTEKLNISFAGYLVDAPDVRACHGSYLSVLLEQGSFAAGARCYVDDPAAVTMKPVHLRVTIESELGEHAADVRDIKAGRIQRPY